MPEPKLVHEFFKGNFPSSILLGKKLNPARWQGYSAIFGFWDGIESYISLEKLADEMATNWHETSGRMLPVRESFASDDATAYARVASYRVAKGIFNDATPQQNGHSFYGRGYVSFNHASNYKKSGCRLKIGDAFFDNPDLVIDRKVVANTLLSGTMEDLFRSVNGSLLEYFNSHDQRMNAASDLINGDKSKNLSWTGGKSIGSQFSEYGRVFNSILKIDREISKMSLKNKLPAVFAVFALLFSSTPAIAQSNSLKESAKSELIFKGACDGSAAVGISERGLLVANDETNVLASYDVLGGVPIATRSLNGMLGLGADDNADVKEIDIEAAVIHGNQTWWIGSHGQNKKGKERLIRKSIFSTNVPHADLSNLEIKSPRADLLSVLIGSEMTARFFSPGVLRRAPKEGGVNIEAMSFDQAGNLMLGFRAPLGSGDGLTGKALLVRLSPTLAGFQVSRVQELDLNDRGLRDIIAFEDAFLIIAGPVSNRASSSIYQWDGENRPIEISLDVMKDFNPEALVIVKDQLFVFSDDGSSKRHDEEQNGKMRECKKIREGDGPGNSHPNVYFRARVFPFK